MARATATRPDTEHTRHFDRKVDAQQWLDQVTATVVTGTYADPKAGQITFAAFFGEWSVRQVWAPGTVLAMSLAARSVPFGDKAMRQFRRSDVEVWIKSMGAAGLAPGTIKTRYVNVRSVFRAAVRDRVIGTDPTDTVRLPRRRRADAAMSIPTPADVGLLMTAADDGFGAFVAMCAFAGLRLAEAAAVQLGDVDFVGAALAVTRQVQGVNGGAINVRAPKYGSERVVYLANGLVDLLAQHVADFGTIGDEQWLFTGEGDQPPHQNPVGYWWRKTLRVAGLSDIKLHDLRHFTHPASSQPAATSSPSNARSATRTPPRHSTPMPTCGLPRRAAPARLHSQSLTLHWAIRFAITTRRSGSTSEPAKSRASLHREALPPCKLGVIPAH